MCYHIMLYLMLLYNNSVFQHTCVNRLHRHLFSTTFSCSSLYLWSIFPILFASSSFCVLALHSYIWIITYGDLELLIQAVNTWLLGHPSQQLVAHCSPAGVLDCLASELLSPPTWCSRAILSNWPSCYLKQVWRALLKHSVWAGTLVVSVSRETPSTLHPTPMYVCHSQESCTRQWCVGCLVPSMMCWLPCALNHSTGNSKVLVVVHA